MFEIEHLKSGLSISTHWGCNLGCSYCVVNAISNNLPSIQKVSTPQNLVYRLLSGQELFEDGMTPLFINNRTDPFLPNVQNDTVELLVELARARVKSPIVIITKIIPRIDFKQLFSDLNIIFLYSYSGIEGDFNYNTINQIESLKEVVPSRSLYHYLRPIIPECNDELEYLERLIFQFNEAGFSGSVLSGLRLTSNNYHVVHKKYHHMDKKHKFISHELSNSLFSTVHEKLPNYSVFRHTSCLIDRFMKRENRLKYYLKDSHCNPYCKNLEICAKVATIDKNRLFEALFKLNIASYDYDEIQSTLHIHSRINEESIAFLRNAYGLTVKALDIALSPSESLMIL